MEYTPRERFWLRALAVAGFAGLNGTFAWAIVRRPDAVAATMTNPLAAVFVVEALVLVGVLAYLLARWKVTHVHWGWFVVLSLVGSIAFALPVVLLWRREPKGPSLPGRG